MRNLEISLHQGAILGLLFIHVSVVLGGGEVDAGAALERGEEGGGHAGAEPARHPFQPLVRQDRRLLIVLHFAEKRERERERKEDQVLTETGWNKEV